MLFVVVGGGGFSLKVGENIHLYTFWEGIVSLFRPQNHEMMVLNMNRNNMIYKIIILQTEELTSVSAHFTNLSFLNIATKPILASINASRIPIQFLGPWPNGMNTNGSRLAFSSEVNLPQ